MTRRAARITHDEVRRMVKAVRSCGLSVGRIDFDGERLSVVIGGEIGETEPNSIDTPPNPETVQSLDEYKAWRDRSRAREN